MTQRHLYLLHPEDTLEPESEWARRFLAAHSCQMCRRISTDVRARGFDAYLAATPSNEALGVLLCPDVTIVHRALWTLLSPFARSDIAVGDVFAGKDLKRVEYVSVSSDTTLRLRGGEKSARYFHYCDRCGTLVYTATVPWNIVRSSLDDREVYVSASGGIFISDRLRALAGAQWTAGIHVTKVKIVDESPDRLGDLSTGGQR